MGNFFTSTQMYNPNLLDREHFINFFCEEMKKNGYVTSNSDESEISYILRFDDNCKWVAITSEAYEQGNQFSQSDTGRIAKMLKTVCINTTVIDSDCASLDLYDESGNKKDSLIMGRADDYFGDDIPEPSECTWKPFLAESSLWEKLCEIFKVSSSYAFVEDCLSKFASVIGMDCENILFCAENADENMHTVFLNFKKAEAKNVKTISLNAAFKQIFGKLLEPMGFKLIKSKYPYYLRVVGEGIIQAVSFSKEKSLNFDPNEEGVSIYIGISLLSNHLINFDKNPTIIDNQRWMISSAELFRRFYLFLDGFNEFYEECSFFYKKGQTDEMLNALEKSRQEHMPFVLEFLQKLKTLEDIYQAGEITGLKDDATILLGKIDNLIMELKDKLPEKIKMLETVHANNPGLLEILKEKAIKDSDRVIKYFASLEIGGEAYDDYIRTAEETKDDNLKVLEELGVLSKKG